MSTPPTPPHSRRHRRIAVIGAGPAGAIAVDALVKEQAFDVVRVFERKAVAGGTWVYDPAGKPTIPSVRTLLNGKADQPVDVPTSFPVVTSSTPSVNNSCVRFFDSGVHDQLHSNLPPQTMCYTQEPLPDTLSERTRSQYGENAPFRHREVVREWVEQIVSRHSGSVSFSTCVERAEKAGEEWLLTLRKEDNGENHWWQESFDALVVASGHYSLPYLPPVPGLAEFSEKFPGHIRHSKHYRGVDDYRGKRVVVVGGSVSAFDALHEIRRVAQHPVIASLRKPLPAFGWGAFTHPHVAIRPPITKFCPQTGEVEFADGSVVEVDIVLFATGYDFSFPFLESVSVKDRRICGLYQHVFSIEDPSLAFVGMVAGGLTFRVYEWQAVAVARVLAGRGALPPKEVMHKWEADLVAATSARGDPDGRFCSIAPDFRGYFEGLRQIAGDPAPGTTGRVLPPFQQKWADAFDEVVRLRLAWWEKERQKAEREEADKMGVKVIKGAHSLDRPHL